MKTYEGTARREEGFWVVEIPELNLVTQARRLSEIERMARSIISLQQEVSGDAFDLEIDIQLPRKVQSELSRARDLRRQAAEKNREAARLSRDAVRQLHDQGMSMREVGDALGISHQRVKQLVDGSRGLASA